MENIENKLAVLFQEFSCRPTDTIVSICEQALNEMEAEAKTEGLLGIPTPSVRFIPKQRV